MNARRVYQVVEHAHIAGIRDAHHCVRQVPVKRGEKPEPVFAREIFAAGRSCTRDRQAASFPAEDVLLFVHGDLEPALNQLMCGAEAANATAQDRNSD
jgi:hypothetical protein